MNSLVCENKQLGQFAICPDGKFLRILKNFFCCRIVSCTMRLHNPTFGQAFFVAAQTLIKAHYLPHSSA